MCYRITSLKAQGIISIEGRQDIKHHQALKATQAKIELNRSINSQIKKNSKDVNFRKKCIEEEEEESYCWYRASNPIKGFLL